MTGTTIAQAIPIAISPILTRIYTPEDFGIFTLYLSILGLVAVIATGRYEMAIVLPKSDEEAINILALSIFITLFLTFFTALIIVIFGEKILNMLNANNLGDLLYLMPLSLLLAGLYQSFNYWSNRKKHFKNMANSRIAQTLGSGVGQLGFGFSTLSGGMILGNLLGGILSVYVLMKKFFLYDKNLIKNVEKEKIIIEMKKYKNFPLVNSLHVFSDVLKTSLSTMLIASFFGSSILGFYALSLRILQVPLGIIGSSFGQVLYQRFNSAKENNETIYIIAKNILIKLFIIALPVFSLLYFVAPDLFSFIFGEKWRIAGEYTQILLPYLFLNFLISPISQIPIILGKQKTFFIISLVINAIIPILLYTYSDTKNIEEILQLSVLLLVIMQSVELLWIIIISKNK